MQPCLCLSDSLCLDKEVARSFWGGGCSSFCAAAGDRCEPDKPPHSSSSLLKHSPDCKPHISLLSANMEGGHYGNKWFLFQPGSWVNGTYPHYFMAQLLRMKCSSNLSSQFPHILWGYWILQSLTVCSCAFAALCFTLLILTRGWFVSSQ